MRVYSFNDFKYICYIEGKGKAVEKIFSGLLETKELKSFYKNLEKKHLDINTIYNEYLFQSKNK
ncbi:hypothetical protein E1Z16_07090 [Listeria monocytogenes]|uniref:Uncharacterized protein n=3 Tax=Listeria monocytogenes TaxID=1639 RepID=A0A3T2A1Q7_LISMN|nr:MULTISPECIES: hypothetical protein [Listeria]EAE3759158.1 hypothetical protein [Listeria monocytogenes serotype 1/2b]EAG6288779.1 hypothetical protein [Listeria monocytogenes CFSAN003825]EAG6316033.1 hypothetical protein [Listeria monocytogenes CFSAN003824]AGR03112.1 hypothetical protein M642_04120 [Listeria monocytogenes]AQP79475.1 hypothetical protein B0X21_06595 [Listeria monocytogenes]